MGQHTDFHGSKRKVNQYSRHTFITKRQRCALFNVFASAAPCATKAGGSKLATLELWPPYTGYLQKRMILLWVFWQFFTGKIWKSWNKPREFNLCLEKKQSFHGVTTAHLAIRRSKPMNRRLSHRPGGQRGIPRVCCEIRMRLYLKMGYTMVYGYTVYPKKNVHVHGENMMIHRKRPLDSGGQYLHIYIL